MIQTIVRKFGGLVDIQGWTPGGVLARKADNTGFEWISVVKTDDTRLTDAREPLAHLHTASDLSGVVKTINGVSPSLQGNINVSAGTGTSKYSDDISTLIITSGQTLIDSSYTFILGTLEVCLNGIEQTEGVGNDFIVRENAGVGIGITMNNVIALEPGDHLILKYELS